jgi:hypothetical protein
MNFRFTLIWAPPVAALFLTACGARQALNNIGSAATRAPAPSQNAMAQTAPPSAPCTYQVSAVASGPVVMFTVKNNGTQPLEIRRQDFALLVPGKNRRVIPFNESVGTLDLQQGPLMPSQTLQGRVIFKDIQTPAGHRLVYKPDEKGTFAIIANPSAKI